MNFRHLYVIGFLLVTATISWHDVKTCGELPWPPRIVMTGLVFAMLDLFAGFQPELAAIMALGFALAMIVNGKLNAVCNTTKPCACAGQASDLVGIPPPKVIEPNATGPYRVPLEPPASTPIEPAPIVPELPGGALA